MARSIASFGAGAILIATSVLPSLVQADLHKQVHRTSRHAHIRRAASAVPTGWESYGCFTDADAPNRVLAEHHTDPDMTISGCIKSCAASGYTLAGAQFGKECWCGSALNTAGGAGKLSAGGCDMPCAGDASQTCGGNYFMNVFAMTSGTGTKPSTSAVTSYAATATATRTSTKMSTYAAPSSTSKSYTLKDKFAGEDFFDGWTFFNYPDPTNGQVDYLSREDATAAGLAYVQEDGVAVMKVDNTTTLGAGELRKSVRIHSNKQYNSGLFVTDILQMPYGCSIWPAYWTVGDNWPNNGEIDILENVNLATANQYTLHTGSNSTCTLDSDPVAKYKSTSNMMGKTCASKDGANAGCGFSDPNTSSYGQGFNDVGGAVLAMDWQTSGIRIWSFKRDSIPSDLQGDAANPNPDSWGAPVAAWTSAACDIANEVKNHNIIFDITLCGGWAGDHYASSGCPGTCSDRIMDPANFDNAVWKVKSVTVYQ